MEEDFIQCTSGKHFDQRKARVPSCTMILGRAATISTCCGMLQLASDLPQSLALRLAPYPSAYGLEVASVVSNFE